MSMPTRAHIIGTIHVCLLVLCNVAEYISRQPLLSTCCCC
jgi:hypothetical protein